MEIEEVRKLVMHKGDVLLVQTAHPVSMETAMRMKLYIKDTFQDDIQVLVHDTETNFKVITQADPSLLADTFELLQVIASREEHGMRPIDYEMVGRLRKRIKKELQQ